MRMSKLKGNKISYLLVVCLVLTFFICGCSTENKVEETNKSESDLPVSTVTEPTETNEKPVSSADSETFYKLRVQEGTFDEAVICSFWIPSFDADKVTSSSNAEGATKQITVDGVTYYWIINGNTFMGYCDKSDFDMTDEETAKQLGAQFINGLEYQTNSSPSITTDECGIINLEYSFQYDGVEILGNKILYIGRGDETGTSGTYLSLGICDTGICNIYISNLMQITSTVATYQEDTDFIGSEQAKALTESYYDQLVDESGAYAATTNQTEVNVIYFPYLEDGNSMLIPVYEVTALTSDGNQFYAILDALTGYVYSAQ